MLELLLGLTDPWLVPTLTAAGGSAVAGRGKRAFGRLLGFTAQVMPVPGCLSGNSASAMIPTSSLLLVGFLVVVVAACLIKI